MIGQTILHYKIIEKLGEGGMGIVYKAHDTKLDRLVALKFLPLELTKDRGARERFIHEAKAASGLDHTNICTIHEVGETDNGQLYIAMACYDGETLKDRIERSPLKVEDAIDITTQIALGLSKAHEKNIVHRDIKPANILITTDGVVKILDFGLAKLRGLSKLTKTGSTLGTAPYMSPEQARGEAVDHRTDIWSLGVLMYEMITGQLPFKGDYEQAVVYQILNEEPVPITGLRSNVPMELERIVNKAIKKDRSERYQHVEDLLVDIRSLKKEIDSGFSRGQPTVIVSGKRKRIYLYFATALLVICSCIVLFLTRHPSEINPNMSFRTLHVPLSEIYSPGLSADGNWIAFPASGRFRGVYFMNTSGGEPKRITSDVDIWPWHADISPDGSQIIYDCLMPETNLFSLFTVSSLGGAGKIITEVGFNPKWRPDGKRIGYILGAGAQWPSMSGKLEFWSVGSDGSDNRLEFVDSANILFGTPAFAWSPDGWAIAWIRGYPDGYKEVIIHEIGSKRERQLTFDKKIIDDVCWTVNGQIIFSSDKGGYINLWTVPIDGGEVVQITKGTGPHIGVKTSADGKKLVYLEQKQVAHIYIANIDGGSARQITYDDRVLEDPALSPNGKKISFVIRDFDYQDLQRSGGIHVYLMDRDGENRQQLTSGVEMATCPAWSPDGKWIAYSSRMDPVDSSRIYLIDVSHKGTSQFVSNGMRVWWIDKESFIIFRQTSSWMVLLDGSVPKRFYQDSTWAVPIFGGKNILFYDLHKGREGWWITSSLTAKHGDYDMPRKICSTDLEIVLSPSGKFMFFVTGKFGSSEITAYYISLPEGKKKKLQLSKYPNIGLRLGAGLSSSVQMSHDGREVVFSQSGQTGKLVMIENLFK